MMLLLFLTSALLAICTYGLHRNMAVYIMITLIFICLSHNFVTTGYFAHNTIGCTWKFAGTTYPIPDPWLGDLTAPADHVAKYHTYLYHYCHCPTNLPAICYFFPRSLSIFCPNLEMDLQDCMRQQTIR